MLAFLRRSGLAARDENPAASALAGGVSSHIWRVELARGAVCVKRALPRLRVAQRWEAPIERNRYERRWIETANRIVPGIAPRVLAADEAAGCFAMEDLGALPLWKAATSCGSAVMRMRRAIKVPIAPPITTPTTIREKLTTCGMSSVVATAMTMPTMPNRLPERADSGEERPRRARMKRIEERR